MTGLTSGTDELNDKQVGKIKKKVKMVATTWGPNNEIPGLNLLFIKEFREFDTSKNPTLNKNEKIRITQAYTS